MVEKNMITLTERTIMKSRSGVYSDTSENRRKHRVGQKYGAEKQPEDGEKTEKKKTDPAKELEAVNKVIAAINEGKLNLPAAEVIKLSEKKQKLEAAKKYISENKDAKDVEQVQDVIRKVELRKEEIKETSSEETEVYTRVKFDDVPNSGKVNLKKYLSEKVRTGVDEKWSNIKKIPTENLKKMEKGLVNDLNKNFEAIKKSQRAELLYSIMKVRGELESRGKETSKEGNKESGKLSDLQSKVSGYMNMPEYKKYISAKSEVDNFGKVPSGGDKRQRYDELNEQLIEATKKYKEALKKKITT